MGGGWGLKFPPHLRLGLRACILQNFCERLNCWKCVQKTNYCRLRLLPSLLKLKKGILLHIKLNFVLWTKVLEKLLQWFRNKLMERFSSASHAKHPNSYNQILFITFSQDNVETKFFLLIVIANLSNRKYKNPTDLYDVVVL